MLGLGNDKNRGVCKMNLYCDVMGEGGGGGGVGGGGGGGPGRQTPLVNLKDYD